MCTASKLIIYYFISCQSYLTPLEDRRPRPNPQLIYHTFLHLIKTQPRKHNKKENYCCCPANLALRAAFLSSNLLSNSAIFSASFLASSSSFFFSSSAFLARSRSS
jgi:hypothetical protein